MSKKLCYSEMEAMPKMAVRKSHRSDNGNQRGLERDQDGDQHQDRNQEKYQDQYQCQHQYQYQYQSKSQNTEEAEEAPTRGVANGHRKPVHQCQGCPCPVHHRQQEQDKPELRAEREVSDSSDAESRRGIGFVDLFRRRTHYERVGTTALELYSLNHLPMNKDSRDRIMREFLAGQEALAGPSGVKKDLLSQVMKEAINLDGDKSLSPGSASPQDQCSPPPESKIPLQTKFRNQFSLKSAFQTHCYQESRESHWQFEDDPRWSRRDKCFPQKITPPVHFPPSPDRIYTVKSTTRYTLRLHSGETPTESSDEGSGKAPETEIENNVGLPTKSLGQTESQDSFSYFSKLDSIKKSPSVGNRIVLGSRGSKRDTCEMDSRGRRTCGGCLPTPTTCRCRMHKPEEPGQEPTGSSRLNSKSRSGSSSPEARARGEQDWDRPSTSAGPPVEILLSPRILVYSQSSELEVLKERQSREYMGESSLKTSFEAHTQAMLSTEASKSEDLPSAAEEENNSSGSESEPDFRCSRGLRLPSLRSCDTFTDVWRKESPRGGYQSQATRPTGGLYGRVDKLKFKPIDRLDAGFSGSPIFEGAGEEVARERTQYFATEFDKLSQAERQQDTELRIGQLRILQATSDKAFRRHYEEQRPVIWPVRTNGMRFCCPLGYRQCPPVMNASLLGHTLSHHLNEHGLELREVFAGDRLLLIFNPRSYDLGINSCMSAMMYAGVRNEPSTLPGRRFLPNPNTKLPADFAQYTEHLPLFVMICRNRKSAIDGSESTDEEHDDVLALWMLSVDLPLPVHVIMTVLNRRLDVTRSSIMQVRSLHQSQNCRKFMRSSRQYMRLSEQDLSVLTSNNTEPLYMEVSVKEYTVNLPGMDCPEP